MVKVILSYTHSTFKANIGYTRLSQKQKAKQQKPMSLKAKKSKSKVLGKFNTTLFISYLNSSVLLKL